MNNRGGYIDYLADEHWFKADSKKMRALRAFALQASLARVASVSPKNDQDRQLMAIRIGNTTRRANFVLKCAFDENPVSLSSAPFPVAAAKNDPCFYFDSLMVDYTTALLDLAMIAFPIEDTKRLLNVIGGGFFNLNPASALDALGSLINLAKEAVKYGRVVGAIYRDTVELEVQIWLASPSQAQDGIPAEFKITESVVANLRAVYSRGNDDMVAWKAEMAALQARGLEPVPARKFIFELANLIAYLCTLITTDTVNDSLATCRGNLPLINPTDPVPGTTSFIMRGNPLAWRFPGMRDRAQPRKTVGNPPRTSNLEPTRAVPQPIVVQ